MLSKIVEKMFDSIINWTRSINVE